MQQGYEYQIGQLAGGLIATFLVSRLLLWLLRDWNAAFTKVVFVHAVSLMLAALIGGMGGADGGPFAPIAAGVAYLVPQAVWLCVDLVRTNGRRSQRHASSAVEQAEATGPEPSVSKRLNLLIAFAGIIIGIGAATALGMFLHAPAPETAWERQARERQEQLERIDSLRRRLGEQLAEGEALRLAVASFRDCAECPELVRVPGERFAAGRYEVTFAEWDACVADGGCNGYSPGDEGWGRASRPVINVNWNDAQAYVQWLSRRTGQRYRLLTATEWGITAQGGTATVFPWGDYDPECHFAPNGANFSDCASRMSRHVGEFQPNPYGFYDVYGNVWEWVEDEINEGSRFIQGGAWSVPSSYLNSAEWFFAPQIDRRNDIGFRVARSVES